MPHIKRVLITIALSFSLLLPYPFAQATEEQGDPLPYFRQLLAAELDPSKATIEKVFNPIGSGQSLLVRSYISGPEELIYQPLFSEAPSGAFEEATIDSFTLRALPGTEIREALINFDDVNGQYQLYFGHFNYSVSPDLSRAFSISVEPEAVPFLAKNFQTLFINQPLAGLSVRHLLDMQQQEKNYPLMQLRKQYIDSITGETLINSHGDVLGHYRFKEYESLPVKPVYFIEQRLLNQQGSVRYYIHQDGLRSARVKETGEESTGNWIPLQDLQKKPADINRDSP